tara:strand:+ start:277 stop:495 length:219 start_codon:yes stop_codon:yes gene_type:complete
MNVSHMTTEQLEDRLDQAQLAQRSRPAIIGIRLIDAIHAELQRRKEILEQCSGDCGDCCGYNDNACQARSGR